MEQKEYLENRLEDQIRWYGRKSQSAQWWFKRLRFLEILSAALIPFLAGISQKSQEIPLIIGLLGVVIAVCAGMSALCKFQENWIQYRTTAETLKHEQYLFQAGCAPYDGNNAFCLLVRRVEGSISRENTQWAELENKGEKT